MQYWYLMILHILIERPAHSSQSPAKMKAKKSEKFQLLDQILIYGYNYGLLFYMHEFPNSLSYLLGKAPF